MESIYAQFQQEPRFRPSSLVPPRIAAGLYGRKSGEGWYRYADGAKQEPPRAPVPAGLTGVKTVWIEPGAQDYAALAALAAQAGLEVLQQPGGADLLIVQPWGLDATSCCVQQGIDARRTVAVDPLPGLKRHRSLMLTAVTQAAARDAARALLAQDGVAVTVINDSPGFVVQRVLATVVNIAANIAQRRIASVADIEDAVRLGLGYPHGPLSWGDRIGGENVLNILRNLQAVTGDPRYRPSPWLTRRVALGVSLLTEEAARA
jgi:3-hydroxybutyryl-CoA dehydrogenase